LQAVSEFLANDLGAYSCAVTGFAGLEPEILRLRNTNRTIPETLAYLTWRYRASADAPPPCVYWLLDPNGQRVGMASAIFRPYRVNGTRVQTAVIGDISVDARLRGHGLGQMLLRSLTTHLNQQFPQHPALVIPTESARRTLASVGWQTGGSLVPLVYVLDPARYVKPLLRSEALANTASRSIRAAERLLVRRHVPRHGVLHLNGTPEDALLQFAQRLPASPGVVRDLGPEFLQWRYAQHPHTRFTFASFKRLGEIRGFLVFEDSSMEGTCSIYDFVGKTAQDLRAMLALFVLRSLATPGLVTLRVLLDEHHPGRAQLRRLGFIARSADAVFQVRQMSAPQVAWQITQGDKDI
jgi:GNAT superfamily N-acetyltransferase